VLLTTIVAESNQVSIPPDIAREFGIHPGTRLEWAKAGEGVITVKPLPRRGELARQLIKLRLHQLGLNAASRATAVNRYRALLIEIVDVAEAVPSEVIRLRTSATAHVAAMDILTAATASLKNATLLHRDPHSCHHPLERGVGRGTKRFPARQRCARTAVPQLLVAALRLHPPKEL
jgi:antitoxin component of MazEF toxin-antitoxin module